MTDEEKKEFIKRLYSKRGIETDLVDDIEFSVINEYSEKIRTKPKLSVVMANLGLLEAENKALKVEMKNLLDCCEFSHGAIVDAIAEVGLDRISGERVVEMIEEQLTKHKIDFVKFKVSAISDS